MKKFFIFLSFAFLFFVVLPKEASAALCPASAPTNITEGQTVTISYDLSGTDDKRLCRAGVTTGCFEIRGCNTDLGGVDGCWANYNFPLHQKYDVSVEGNSLVATVNPGVTLTYWLEYVDINGNRNPRTCAEQKLIVTRPQFPATCAPGTFTIVRSGTNETDYTFNDNLEIVFDGSKTSGFHDLGFFALYVEDPQGSGTDLGDLTGSVGGNGKLHWGGSISARIGIGKRPVGMNRLVVTDSNILGSAHYCIYNFEVSEDGENDQGGDEVGDSGQAAFELCQQAGDNLTQCTSCFDQDGIWTAVGCIPYGEDGDFSGIIQAIIQLGLGIGGGVVILMVLAGGFVLSTSQGDPKRVEEAKEMITSAVMGLLFIIFSITILRFIGIRILQIPGFGS